MHELNKAAYRTKPILEIVWSVVMNERTVIINVTRSVSVESYECDEAILGEIAKLESMIVEDIRDKHTREKSFFLKREEYLSHSLISALKVVIEGAIPSNVADSERKEVLRGLFGEVKGMYGTTIHDYMYELAGVTFLHTPKSV